MSFSHYEISKIKLSHTKPHQVHFLLFFLMPKCQNLKKKLVRNFMLCIEKSLKDKKFAKISAKEPKLKFINFPFEFIYVFIIFMVMGALFSKKL